MRSLLNDRLAKFKLSVISYSENVLSIFRNSTYDLFVHFAIRNQRGEISERKPLRRTGSKRSDHCVYDWLFVHLFRHLSN